MAGLRLITFPETARLRTGSVVYAIASALASFSSVRQTQALAVPLLGFGYDFATTMIYNQRR